MAKKKTQQKANAVRTVEQHKVPYKEYEFAWSEDHLNAESAAESLGIEEGRIFRALVTVGNKTGPVVVIIPGNQELDLKELTKVSDNKEVEMPHLKDLEATIGCIRGGCSPIGMKEQFPTYLAEEVQQYSAIIISAGRRGMQIELALGAILSLTNGQFAEITTKE